MSDIKINQIKLMAAIATEITEQNKEKTVPASPEVMNACIDAANLVKGRLDPCFHNERSEAEGGTLLTALKSASRCVAIDVIESYLDNNLEVKELLTLTPYYLDKEIVSRAEARLIAYSSPYEEYEFRKHFSSLSNIEIEECLNEDSTETYYVIGEPCPLLGARCGYGNLIKNNLRSFKDVEEAFKSDYGEQRLWPTIKYCDGWNNITFHETPNPSLTIPSLYYSGYKNLIERISSMSWDSFHDKTATDQLVSEYRQKFKAAFLLELAPAVQVLDELTQLHNIDTVEACEMALRMNDKGVKESLMSACIEIVEPQFTISELTP